MLASFLTLLWLAICGLVLKIDITWPLIIAYILGLLTGCVSIAKKVTDYINEH